MNEWKLSRGECWNSQTSISGSFELWFAWLGIWFIIILIYLAISRCSLLNTFAQLLQHGYIEHFPNLESYILFHSCCFNSFHGCILLWVPYNTEIQTEFSATLCPSTCSLFASGAPLELCSTPVSLPTFYTWLFMSSLRNKKLLLLFSESLHLTTHSEKTCLLPVFISTISILSPRSNLKAYSHFFNIDFSSTKPLTN